MSRSLKRRIQLKAQMKNAASVIFYVLGLTAASSSNLPAEAAILINGAGATFPFPLYSKWFSEYQKIDNEAHINYQSIGSGGGIRQFLQRTVDFGATDSPMTDEQLSKFQVPVLHIPTVIGSVVLIYNLPGVPKGLKLSSEVVADIFLGKITQWNDSRIVQLNPGIALPDTSVIVVRRSDGSGTSAVFTDYLSKISPEWKKRVGNGPSVNWPVGLGGKGNEGVSGLTKQTPGAIGYVELVFAESNSLSYASIQNKAGQYILPSVQSASAAAAGAIKKMPKDFRVSITYSEGTNSYPISAFTYLLVYQTMPEKKGRKIVDFLNWAMSQGQKYAEKLYYSPLPPSIIKEVQTKVRSIQLN